MGIPSAVLLLLAALVCRIHSSNALDIGTPDETPSLKRNNSALRFFYPRSTEDGIQTVSRRRQLLQVRKWVRQTLARKDYEVSFMPLCSDKERFQSHIQKAILSSLNRPTTSTPPTNDKLIHLTLYPSCTGPSDQAQWFPNGHQRFQFYFPTVPTSVRSPTLPFSHQAHLYLRTKNPVDISNKASTPSSRGSTPNDVDANLDAANNVIQVNIVSPGVYFRQSHRIDLSNSYPYVKVPVLFFVASWMATHDKEPQRLEVTVSDPHTNQTLNIGDYFVGMRCATAEPKLSLPTKVDHTSHEYLERLEDSFLDVLYSTTDAYTTSAYFRSTGISMRNLSRLPRSHRAKNRFDPSSLENELRCNKRREFLSFAAAGAPSVISPRGLVFVTCECSRICDDSDSKPCVPCEVRVLKTATIPVLEVDGSEVVMRERTLPSDCGCF
ncbi:uncharacterized protein LOC100901074 [Galendromus occidentalis]|uniref:Uncharacterized protein LOC100901074 n=1 Tax=Galendromus occidentalis TaxID=34638 RepID=A0AAJ7SFW6_9ACAR|nr:uncharacterized protein LOC100901074 [Galendromus occidentalis]